MKNKKEHTVLIVDDTVFMRMMLSKILTENGFEVVAEAENGKVALDMYADFAPDIVTLDITMPEMNGLEALQSLKQRWPEAKVVMVSAMGQKPLVVEAIQNGAKDFIVKPFQPARVIAALRSAINS